ncbi:MAG: hypothetical protein CVT64_09055 [Actinobacteria bacterium HGW-Actinobacteria-4]|nr:MAG: hypothetical protein CVT64_09055 [Actinobacteria bacterium HGW-Actinobacteria-4]
MTSRAGEPAAAKADHAPPREKHEAPPASRRGIRTDIQALRALAVLAVVIYHMHGNLLPGGFAGVDVFFVISGFLIGGALIRELTQRGTIRLGSFYARRVRRILPAALTVTVVTLVVSAVVASPVRLLVWNQGWGDSSIAKDAFAAVLNVPNLWFAFQASDYLAQSAPSPFLHFWSLGVEEQFYVVVPVILILAFVVTRRSLRGLAWVVGGLTAASMLYAWWLIATDPILAFYHPAARAWELGLGVLVALAVQARWHATSLAAVRAVQVAALGALVTWLAWGSAGSAWPHWWALAPVLATAILLWAGSHPSQNEGWWRWAPLQRVGDWSYSLYLWHWPALVLAALWVGRGLRVREAALVVAVSVALAAASHRWIEQPARRMPVADPVQRRRIWIAATASVGATLLVVSGVATFADRATRSQYPIADPLPEVAQLAEVTPSPIVVSEPAIEWPQFAAVLPSNVRPSLADARRVPRVYADGCHLGRGVHVIPDSCTYGTDGPLVAVFGDSHAAQWLEPLLRAADEGTLRVLSLTSSGCPAVPLALAADASRNSQDCDAWRQAALGAMTEAQPDVVLASTLITYDVSSAQDPVDYHANQVEELLNAFPSRARVVWVADTPWMEIDPVECAEANRGALRLCARPRDLALDDALGQAYREQLEHAGVTYLDFTDYMCDALECGLVVGDVMIWRDHHHITVEFSLVFGDILVGAVT